MVEEIKRTYIIPLRRGFFNTPRYKRTNKAVTVLKNFLMKHMKSEEIKLGKHLNEFLWKNGIKNPPGKVRVDVVKTKEGIVKAELSGKKYVDFKMKEKTDKNKTFKEKLKDKVTANPKEGSEISENEEITKSDSKKSVSDSEKKSSENKVVEKKVVEKKESDSSKSTKKSTETKN